jgi:hypothetical protein
LFEIRQQLDLIMVRAQDICFERIIVFRRSGFPDLYPSALSSEPAMETAIASASTPVTAAAYLEICIPLC